MWRRAFFWLFLRYFRTRNSASRQTRPRRQPSLDPNNPRDQPRAGIPPPREDPRRFRRRGGRGCLVRSELPARDGDLGENIKKKRAFFQNSKASIDGRSARGEQSLRHSRAGGRSLDEAHTHARAADSHVHLGLQELREPWLQGGSRSVAVVKHGFAFFSRCVQKVLRDRESGAITLNRSPSHSVGSSPTRPDSGSGD